MAILLSMATCPNCGAPHSVAADRRAVICVFCKASLVVSWPASGAPAQLTAQPVSQADIERVTQLLIDARRVEAIAHYARVAAVSPEDAERAIDNVFVTSYSTLTRQVPLDVYSFLFYAVVIAGGCFLAAWAATQISTSKASLVLFAACALCIAGALAGLARHLRSRLIAAFGAGGRARIVRSCTVHEIRGRRAFIVLAVFEVVPDDGEPTFVDQETLIVGGDCLPKLAQGNVIRVRFDKQRQRVFPVTPVAVVG